MFDQPAMDIIHDAPDIALRLPAGRLHRPATIADVPGDVRGTCLGVTADVQPTPGQLGAVLRQFAKRDADSCPAAGIVGDAIMALEIADLQDQQSVQILDMQDIAYLE